MSHSGAQATSEGVQGTPFVFWVPGPLPGLNEIIAAAKGHGGCGRGYSTLKQQWTDDIAFIIRRARIPTMRRVRLKLVWVSVDKRHDPDNIEAAQKFIWDALKHEVAGVLTNDGWEQNGGVEPIHEIGPKAGVWVTITEVEPLPRARRTRPARKTISAEFPPAFPKPAHPALPGGGLGAIPQGAARNP